MKTVFLISILLCLFISCKKKDSTRDITTNQENKSMENNSIDKCLSLTKEELNFIEKVSEDGLYKNTKRTKEQFSNILLQLKEEDRYPIILKSEEIDIKEICQNNYHFGMNDYYFNMKEMQSKKIGYEGLHILSDDDQIMKSYSQFKIANKGLTQLLLCKTATEVFDAFYSSWIICSIIDNEIVDFASISSTNALESDQLNYTNAEIYNDYKIIIRMFNEEKILLSEIELFIDDNGCFFILHE